MNQEQKDWLKHKTCFIIEKNDNLEHEMKERAIPKKLIKKITKALDLIFEVNQEACK